jgi:mannose-6-phosphate isomerase-like protein (cupin superfamily)
MILARCDCASKNKFEGIKKEILNEGDSVYIEKGTPHQLTSLQEKGVVYEVSTEHFDSDSYRIYRKTPNDLL